MCLSNPLHRRRGLAPLSAVSLKKPITTLPQGQHIVQHNYKDHSNDEPPSDLACIPLVSKTRPRGGVAIPFPLKLHQVLDKIEEDGYGHIISWQPHGRCFVVHNQKEFVGDIMPRYFKQSKFPSFQRQLNLYGFSRLTAGMDKGGYYHEFFLRGKPFLCSNIFRMKVKGTGVRMASSPETEPNFYAMSTVCPKESPKPIEVGSSDLEQVMSRSKRVLMERRRSSDASFRHFMESLQKEPSVLPCPSSTVATQGPSKAAPQLSRRASIVSDDSVLSDDESEPLKTPEMENFFANFGMPAFSDEEEFEFMNDTDLGYALDKIVE